MVLTNNDLPLFTDGSRLCRYSISYKANPINKTEGQQLKPKLITKQTPSTEPKVNS